MCLHVPYKSRVRFHGRKEAREAYRPPPVVEIFKSGVEVRVAGRLAVRGRMLRASWVLNFFPRRAHPGSGRGMKYRVDVAENFIDTDTE